VGTDGRAAGERTRRTERLGLALAELIEAAARSGRPELAAEALERLHKRTQAAGTGRALGIEPLTRSA